MKSTYMKKYGLILALGMSFFMHSQDIAQIQKEIDFNLWKPFKAAFEELDAKKLNALYADEVLRVTPGGIDTDNLFKKGNEERLGRHRKSNTELQLDFWFDSRHTNVDTSYEVGFYRMTLTNSSEVQTIYGQFHIVLKKSDGAWKIAQDWDTDSILGKELSKQDFDKKEPIQFD